MRGSFGDVAPHSCECGYEKDSEGFIMVRRLAYTFALFFSGASVAFAQDRPPVPAVGVGTFIHPLKVQGEPLPWTTPEQRDCVHIFMINGSDPLYVGNLNGLADYFRSLGFAHTYSYRLIQTPIVSGDVVAARQRNPHARIVLLGYSTGANAISYVANDLKRSGVPVDRLIYMGGDTLSNVPYNRPDNAARIVNLRAHGLIFFGYDMLCKLDDIDGAVNVHHDSRHILIPTRRETVTFLSREIVNLALQPVPAAR